MSVVLKILNLYILKKKNEKNFSVSLKFCYFKKKIFFIYLFFLSSEPKNCSSFS